MPNLCVALEVVAGVEEMGWWYHVWLRANGELAMMSDTFTGFHC